jgi:hypothetical protein
MREIKQLEQRLHSDRSVQSSIAFGIQSNPIQYLEKRARRWIAYYGTGRGWHAVGTTIEGLAD